jgi:TolB-like protein
MTFSAMRGCELHSRRDERPFPRLHTIVAVVVLSLAVAFYARKTAAQDLGTVSSTLAGQIGKSGRKTVAVVDFTDLEGNPTKLGRYLAEELSVSLMQRAAGFDVIDRTHLKEILQEHKLSATGLIDPQTARKLGELVGADTLVTASITPFGDSVRLSIKAIDPGTAKIIAAATADVPKTPAISALLGETLGDASGRARPGTPGSSENSPGQQSQTKPVKAAVPAKAQASGFKFVLEECKRAGDALTCTGYVTNNMSNRRTLNLNSQTEGISSIIDDAHVQYDLKQHQNVIFGTSGQQQELEENLPIGFRVSLQNFSQAASSVTVILACWTNEPYSFFKVTLRNIAITQN